MTASFVRRTRFSPYIASPTHARTSIRHLDRPHATSLDIHVTAAEVTLLIVAMIVLIALLAWLAWISLSQCLRYVKGKMNVASQARAQANKNMDRAEQVERLFGRTARDLMEGFFDGGWSRDIEGNGREERGPLLGGWYGGLGWRREGDRYDGTSESSGRTTVVHREDCEGQCGVQSRRRSGASEER